MGDRVVSLVSTQMSYSSPTLMLCRASGRTSTQIVNRAGRLSGSANESRWNYQNKEVLEVIGYM